MDLSTKRELARLLSLLRREERQQSGLDPRLVPPDRERGYQVAALVADELGWEVGGWKIAAVKAEMQKALRTDRPIYGRVFRQLITAAPCSLEFANLASPLPEVEYQALLGSDLPPREEPYRIEDVADAVASLHTGIEIGECRFVHDAAFPPLSAILADGAGSGRLIVGPPIDDWRSREIAGQEATLFCNGKARRTGTAAAAIDHPLVPLAWLANELSRAGIGLKAGELISTGTLTGMVAARTGESWRADYGPFGSVGVTFT